MANKNGTGQTFDEYSSFVEDFEREAGQTAPAEGEIVALARRASDTALDAEKLRQLVIENAHLLPREISEKYNAIILNAPYKSYKYRIGLLKELSVDEQRSLSRLLEAYSVSAIKFFVLDSMLFDVLVREAYEKRNVTRVTTKKAQQQTRSNRVWGGVHPKSQPRTTEGSAAPHGTPRKERSLEDLAGERLDISNLDSYYEILLKMEAGEFDENELDTFSFVIFLVFFFFLCVVSDLHLHSARTGGRVRYRYQGTPYTRYSDIPLNRFQHIINCLCTLAAKDTTRMKRDIVESVIKLKILLESEIKDVEFRFEALPTLHCPSVNLRGQTKPLRDIRAVGFTPEQLFDIEQAAAKERGIVVVTGPTGSGKTNTLNAIFAKLEELDDKIILELGSPIEIESERRVQITIQETASEKLTDIIYQKMFKACMRFDPDIIAFTEIRNGDEARIAFRAANTGHLVFTTMHAADVEETFGRLFEMSIDRSIISKGILAIVAQTLIRRLCDYCKVADPDASLMSGMTIYRENEEGCGYCDGGFAGRTVVSEVLHFNDDVRQMIVKGCKPSEICQKSVEKGYMIPMKRIALGKLNSGITSESEVIQLIELRTELNSDAEDMPIIVEDDEDFYSALPVQDGEFEDVRV